MTPIAIAFISTVFGYSPAPGQFINAVPEINPDASPEEVAAIVAEQICGGKTPGLISLGSFGGNVVFGFDHPVVNVPDVKDFVIYGNSMANGSEPGIVMVSRDENGNGLPDDPWYELKGSEEENPLTIFNYSITYHRPDADREPVADPDRKFVTDAQYIFWEDSLGESGYIPKIASHAQSYWPEWEDAVELMFTGTRLPSNAEPQNETGTNYKISTYEWGYADNQPNSSDPGFDISNAVDAERNPVWLPEIDFIKVYTAVNDQRGWLGEGSTEVAGGMDLHPEAVSGIDLPTDGKLFAAVVVGQELIIHSSVEDTLRILDSRGATVMSREINSGETRIDISTLQHGIYLAVCSKVVKFVV